MSRLKLIVLLAILGTAGWKGYGIYLKKRAPPGTYRFDGENKPCSYFGDGRAQVLDLRETARKAKRRAERNGDIDEVTFQMAQESEYDAALDYCW